MAERAVFSTTMINGIAMRRDTLTAGKLAHQTGLSVRTLHYYDEIGLLKPSLHTDAGYRIYTPGDLRRLQEVLILRQLGLPLTEVRERLEDSAFSLSELIHRYVVHLREHIELQSDLCERLQAICAVGEASPDDLLKTLRVIIAIENCRGD
jgi:MerR family transcriptional regulator, thiopeptide resistance regulator